jgi:hypothetical protein
VGSRPARLTCIVRFCREKRRKDGVQRKVNIRQRVKRETREELQPTIKSVGV